MSGINRSVTQRMSQKNVDFNYTAAKDNKLAVRCSTVFTNLTSTLISHSLVTLRIKRTYVSKHYCCHVSLQWGIQVLRDIRVGCVGRGSGITRPPTYHNIDVTASNSTLDWGAVTPSMYHSATRNVLESVKRQKHTMWNYVQYYYWI
jgi:hypothetical protein